MKHTVSAFIRPGEQAGFVAECPDLNAATQGSDLDEVVANLREIVSLALDGEDLEAIGLSSSPVIIVSMELEPAA